MTERHAARIEGVLGCWDRMLVFGTLPKIRYAEGMTSYLFAKQVRIFDSPRFADPCRNQLRENAEQLAAANGIEIEFLRKRNVRKEDRVKEILGKPWHGKQTGKTCRPLGKNISVPFCFQGPREITGRDQEFCSCGSARSTTG